MAIFKTDLLKSVFKAFTALRAKVTLWSLVAIAAGLIVARVSIAADKTLVVFTAGWCANCRDVIPVIEDVAREQGLAVVMVDVDKQDAPKLAKTYNLAVPSLEPPQVYYIMGTQKTLLFDGRNYNPAQPASKLKSQLLQQLPR
ncbi:MAG: thioredoxin family protein [Vampirovibrionales bacterium]|nr:thioredoxin family protein [Vampirovibrionales bacterium]